MADSHIARDGSYRRSYSHDMRASVGGNSAKLAHNNTGLLYAWNPQYWELHEQAWGEAARVLRPDGIFVLNTSDFIRGGEVVSVTKHHIDLLIGYGFSTIDTIAVATPRMRRGSNGNVRVDHEDITILGQ